MNILITSGSTNHFIDNVNFISHISDGQLGANIGEEFSKYPEVEKIFYICGRNSTYPWQHLSANDSKFFLEEWSDKIVKYVVDDVEEIETVLNEIVKTHEISAFIQMMSIANYSESLLHHVSNKKDAVALIEKIAKDFSIPVSFGEMNLEGLEKNSDSERITSGHKRLFIEQKPTKKILKEIKHLTKIPVTISSKFEYNISEEEMVSIGTRSLQKNKSDMVIAVNINEKKENENETSYLIHKEEKYQRFDRRYELVEMVVEKVFNELK